MSLPRYPEYKDSGVDWLGEVPRHWEVKRLKRNLQLLTEKTERRKRPVALENIESWSGRFVETETEFQGEGIAFERGDILFGKLRPYLAKAHLAEISGEAVGDFHVMRPFKDIDGRFAQYQILNRDFITIVDGSTFGAKMPRVSWDFLCNMELATPPKTEQQTIAAFLDRETGKIDALVAEQERLIALLKEKRQAVISHAVTKGISTLSPARVRPLSPDPSPARGEGSDFVNHKMAAKRQLSGEVAGREFPPSSDIAPPPSRGRGWGEGVAMKDSGIEWLGDVPAHWEVRRLKYFADVRLSNIDKHTVEDEPPVLLCNYVDVYKNERINSSIEFMAATASYKQIRRLTLKVGDVIITKDSEDPSDIGVPVLVTEVVPNLVCGYHLALLRPRTNRIGGYLYYLFRSHYVAAAFETEATGMTRYALGKYSIENLCIPLPSAEEQRAIAAFLDEETAKFDSLTAEANRAIGLLQARRSALISAVVTGKIDVRSLSPLPQAGEGLSLEAV